MAPAGAVPPASLATIMVVMSDELPNGIAAADELAEVAARDTDLLDVLLAPTDAATGDAVTLCNVSVAS